MVIIHTYMQKTQHHAWRCRSMVVAVVVVPAILFLEKQQPYTPCCKDYIGLGNRSVFYPYSSVGNTFTFDVAQVTGSNLTSNVSVTETLARAHLKNTYISLVPQVLKRSG